MARNLDELFQWLHNCQPVHHLHIDHAKVRLPPDNQPEVITAFSFSYCDQTKLLMLTNCEIALHLWEKLLEEITEATKNELRKITIEYFSAINGDIVTKLSSCIGKLKLVDSITLTHSKITDAHLDVLVPTILSSKTIASLILCDNDITGDGLYTIYNNIPSQCVLRTLDISNNPCNGALGRSSAIRLLENELDDFVCTFDEDF